MQNFDIDRETEAQIVPIVSSILNRIISRSGHSATTERGTKAEYPRRLAAFHAYEAPPITVDDYLERIFKYSCCSGSSLVLAMIYIERIMTKEPLLRLTELNIHRVLVTSVMVAAKFLDDEHYNNDYWSKIAGVSRRELNGLELDFLFFLDFNINCSLEVFQEYYKALVETAMVKPQPARAELVAPVPVRRRNSKCADEVSMAAAMERYSVQCF